MGTATIDLKSDKVTVHLEMDDALLSSIYQTVLALILPKPPAK